VSIYQKQAESELLENELEKFLVNGGQIAKLKGTEIKQRPPRSTVESDSYASAIQIIALINWCNNGRFVRSRRKAIAERTGLSEQRILQCLIPNDRARLTKGEYKQIKAVLRDIEESELAAGIERGEV
jgi:hypothetical protein